MTGQALIVQGDALRLPLPDASVDLIVTSPPFAFLRAYDTSYPHLEVGAEATPAEFLEHLWQATAEMVRVLKPTGSIFINLGDSYSNGNVENNGDYRGVRGRGVHRPGASSQWTNANAAWLAAVLDCEGSVSGRIFTNTSGGESFVVWMRVGMMDREVVERIYEITGVGQVFQDKRGVWNWHVASQAARYVLERIWPWLRIKQKRTLAAIELCRHVEERAARGFRTLTHNDLAYRAEIVQAIRDWNGHPARPNSYEPPWPAPIPLPDSLAVTPAKSLQLLPERYRIGCVDRLGLIARAVQIWNKPNSLPESVTDRVRRSHEDWVHLTRQPRYYSAIDEVREAHGQPTTGRNPHGARGHQYKIGSDGLMTNGLGSHPTGVDGHLGFNPLGKLPGSVWTIPSEPLSLPGYFVTQDGTLRDFLAPSRGRPRPRPTSSVHGLFDLDPYAEVVGGEDAGAWRWLRATGITASPWPQTDGGLQLRTAASHYAAFPTRWPEQLIKAFSPPGICVDCEQGRVPVVERDNQTLREGSYPTHTQEGRAQGGGVAFMAESRKRTEATILGYACACTPHTDHPGSGEPSGPDKRYGDYLPEAGYPKQAENTNGRGVTSLQNRPKVGPWREYHLDGWRPPPTRPAVVLDAFGGTGTVAMVARALDRIGISLDLSFPYCRAARWRVHHDANKAISRTNLERQGSLL